MFRVLVTTVDGETELVSSHSNLILAWFAADALIVAPDVVSIQIFDVEARVSHIVHSLECEPLKAAA